MEFIKNELIDEVLTRYFATFQITLDTCDFVPVKYGKKIHKFIFKNMKQKFREVNRAYRKEKRKGGEGASLRPSPPAE